MLPDKLPKWVHRKVAKGSVYLYFDTGRVTPKGKRIFLRLPDYHAPDFHRVYAHARDQREGPGEQDPAVLMVPDLCERFRQGWARRKKPLAQNTRNSYEIYLAVIEDEMAGFPAAEVLPADVLALHQKMADRPGAANQCVRTLSAMFAWAKKPQIGLVATNPAVGIELYEGGEHEPWPEELLEQALVANNPLVRLSSNLLYFSGQRIGDVCAMGWRKILGDYEHMAVVQEKTGDDLEIAIHAELRAVLRSQQRSLGTIIAKPDGTPYNDDTIRRHIQAWAAERGFKVVPHGLRKNAVNALLEARCTAAEVNSITGQSMEMIELYAKKRNRKKLSGSAVLLWEKAR